MGEFICTEIRNLIGICLKLDSKSRNSFYSFHYHVAYRPETLIKIVDKTEEAKDEIKKEAKEVFDPEPKQKK